MSQRSTFSRNAKPQVKGQKGKAREAAEKAQEIVPKNAFDQKLYLRCYGCGHSMDLTREEIGTRHENYFFRVNHLDTGSKVFYCDQQCYKSNGERARMFRDSPRNTLSDQEPFIVYHQSK